MHTKTFFITWFDKRHRLWADEVTGLSGLITKLWLVFEDDFFLFKTVQITVLSD